GSYGTAVTAGSSYPSAETSSFSTCSSPSPSPSAATTQQQYDSQLYSLTNTSFQQQNLNLSPLEIEQDKKDEGEVEEEEDYDQNKDPSNERSGSKWKHDEIKVFLTISKKITQLGQSLIMIWQRVFYLIKSQMQLKVNKEFLANKETGTGIEEEIEIKKENCKKQKPKNNVEVMAVAIAEMSKQEKGFWKKKWK
ncbi:hypothetical protein RhiirA5_413787, partial [Rhizophagus irregularis]